MTREHPKIVPSGARKVFTGFIHDTWQWDQQMFDGSTEIFEAIARTDTVDIFAEVDGKLLLLDQEQPGHPSFLSLPGGRMDPGEDPLTAAKRELLEETGYISQTWELLETRSSQGKIDWTLYTFIARGCAKVAEPHPDAGERIVLQTVTFEELMAVRDDKRLRGKEIKDLLTTVANDPALYAELYTKLLGKPVPLEQIDTCLACEIQSGHRQVRGGTILLSPFFEVHQDFAVPVPGFMILAARWHVRSIADMTPIQQLDYLQTLTRTRQAMRDALGIETVHIFQEEDTKHHFHVMLFPREPWMEEQFGKRLETYPAIATYLKEHRNTDDQWAKVDDAILSLKNYFKEKKDV